METTREQLTRLLRDHAATPSELANQVDSTPSSILDDINHIAQSLADTSETLLVEPPRCRECGFDGFDELINRPSRCPECKSEAIDDPRFLIE